MFRLAAKIYLLLLLLMPLLIWWNRFLVRKGRRHIWFAEKKLLSAAKPTWKVALLKNLNRLKMSSLLLFILALSRPQLLNTYQVQEQKGVDILLTLDISGSMASIDFKPKNRLEVAKEVIAAFIEKRKTDRLGLVIFAAHLLHQVPADH